MLWPGLSLSQLDQLGPALKGSTCCSYLLLAVQVHTTHRVYREQQWDTHLLRSALVCHSYDTPHYLCTNVSALLGKSCDEIFTYKNTFLFYWDFLTLFVLIYLWAKMYALCIQVEISLTTFLYLYLYWIPCSSRKTVFIQHLAKY